MRIDETISEGELEVLSTVAVRRVETLGFFDANADLLKRKKASS